jgi:hypothetical protein
MSHLLCYGNYQHGETHTFEIMFEIQGTEIV